GIRDFHVTGVQTCALPIYTNIKKLQLGCGGLNGATGCDIDIDHIALSGLPANSNYTSEDRANSSALITNPFLQFAIKNPNQASKIGRASCREEVYDSEIV